MLLLQQPGKLHEGLPADGSHEAGASWKAPAGFRLMGAPCCSWPPGVLSAGSSPRNEQLAGQHVRCTSGTSCPGWPCARSLALRHPAQPGHWCRRPERSEGKPAWQRPSAGQGLCRPAGLAPFRVGIAAVSLLRPPFQLGGQGRAGVAVMSCSLCGNRLRVSPSALHAAVHA